MILYSDTALVFLKKVRMLALRILKDEMGLPFERKRLLYLGKYYPLDFLVFEHTKILGEYDPLYYQIRINKVLMYRASEENLKNIIRHELCHYITHIIFGNDIDSHGKEFKSICDRFNYGKDVSCSSVELDELTSSANLKEQKVLDKIKKLLALTSSSNSHEAELATKKVNDLLLQHNINKSHIGEVNEKEEETYLLRVLKTKKVTAKYQAIYKILHHFFVVPVFSYGEGVCHLEIVGEKENVICAEYVAHYLCHTLEELYKEEKRLSSLKGTRAKNSFMLGIASGFIEKFNQRASQSNTVKRELININSKLQHHLNRAYPRIKGRVSAGAKLDETARSLGRKRGENLSIKPAITEERSLRLLPF